MGDLISRNALLEELKEKIYPEKYGEKCNALDVINGVLQVIGEQPVYHGTNKIMEKLENLDEYFDNDYTTSNRKPMYLKEEVLEIVKGA